jgi:AbrB family looped-hinge helix DNA binding protein
MSTITLTSKGQVTLPVEARRILNLQDGDQLIVSVNQETRTLSISKPMTIDDLSAMVQGFIKKRNKKKIIPIKSVDEYYQKHRGETIR